MKCRHNTKIENCFICRFEKMRSENTDLHVENLKLQTSLTEAREACRKMAGALEFYGTFSPRQHPEGFYEIHVSPGVGGEDRFGTKARETLADPLVKKVLGEQK